MCARSKAACQDRLSDGAASDYRWADYQTWPGSKNPLSYVNNYSLPRTGAKPSCEPNCRNLVTSEIGLTIQATKNNNQCYEHPLFAPSTFFLSFYPMNSCEDYWKTELQSNPEGMSPQPAPSPSRLRSWHHRITGELIFTFVKGCMRYILQGTS